MPLKPMYQDLLRAGYAKVINKRRAIRLPSGIALTRLKEGEGLQLTLSTEAVTANMQCDASAFEAWALALRLWCDVPVIALDWDVPPARGGHYERFLYRVDRFQSLFPDWFIIADPAKLAGAGAIEARDLILNVPGGNRSDARMLDGRQPETLLEMTLVQDPAFARAYGLTQVDRQFPVGLFRGDVAKCNLLFTGGKSAIDLVGVGKSGFWLFELKAGRNAAIGGLTELLFYTSLLRDAAGSAARIRFAPEKVPGKVGARDVEQAEALHAVLLVNQRHPLLDHPELVALLNDAANVHWNQSPGTPPVHFYSRLLSESQ